jgi:hypothetical protein
MLASLQAEMQEVRELVDQREGASNHGDEIVAAPIVERIKQKVASKSPTEAAKVTFQDVWEYARIKMKPAE